MEPQIDWLTVVIAVALNPWIAILFLAAIIWQVVSDERGR